MTIDRIRAVFSQALGVHRDLINDDLRYATIKEWDSVAHMSLIAALEEEFNVMLNTDEVIDMNSFVAAIHILKNHGADT